MRTPASTAPHPLGGTFEYYVLSNGRVVSVLDEGYPGHDGFELHERVSLDDLDVWPRTEQQIDTRDQVWAALDTIEALPRREY